MSMDSGMLYAEGYTSRPPGIHIRSAWFLDGEIVAGLGRDIPSRVRDWVLTAGRPAGDDRVAPAWVLAVLLRFPE
jgi:hypothetical protein